MPVYQPRTTCLLLSVFTSLAVELWEWDVPFSTEPANKENSDGEKRVDVRALIPADFCLVYILSVLNLIEGLNDQYSRPLCLNMKSRFGRSRELCSYKLTCAHYISLIFFFLMHYMGIIFLLF